jgi:ribosomal protein S12 methylthiotransferase
MDYPDFSVAQQRAEILEQIQSRIMDDYNASFIGKTVQVLIDGYNEEFGQFYGRTYGDSPDIDGRVWIASDEALMEGTFINVTIDGLVDGDLSGYPQEETV